METKKIVVEVESNLGSLKTQLRNAQLEVATLSEKFGATSTEAINAAKAAARLKDTIGDAKQLTDAFNPDAKFKALTASMSGALNGFQAVEGAMGLFGAEGKAVQETLLKVQSAMALAQGVDGLLEAKDAFKTFGASAISSLKSVYATMLANPIILLIAGVAALTTAFVLFATKSDGVAERIGKGFEATHKAVEKVNKEIAKQSAIQNKTTEETLKNLDRESKRRIAAGEDSVKVQKEVNALKIKALEIAIEEDRSMVRALQNEKLKLQELKNQTEALIVQQVTKARIDYADSLTDIGRSKARQKEFDLIAQLREFEKDNKKAVQDNNKLLYEKTAEIKASKDAVVELTLSQMELNKQEREGIEQREAKPKAESKVEVTGLKTRKAAELEVNKEYLDLNNAAYQESLNKDIEAAKKALDEKNALEKQVRDTKIQMASDAFGVLGELANAFAGKSEDQQRRAFNINKATSIAQATISTYQGATAAFASTAANPISIANPAAPFIAAGIAVASGIAKVAMIARTQFGGGGASSGGGSSSGGGGAIGGGSSPSPANFNIVGNSGTNQLIQGLQNAPIQAYVVGGDVTTAQSLNRNKIATASI